MFITASVCLIFAFQVHDIRSVCGNYNDVIELQTILRRIAIITQQQNPYECLSSSGKIAKKFLNQSL